ncbi:hypothetical protein B0J13DRAFT_625153 [Dactylonectria estremocensis]|uniref:Uncharacterized protein n=1 Tax=Dactylonectria estremocensis TaxID=1079267 RepID=A0A9P9EH48_9HYPO|nr:hypothetical protein B0J13DRAFT_625153 [Dactylonectria estremocensis]
MHIFYYNYLMKDKVELVNPKKLVGESYDDFKDLLRRLKTVRDNTDYDELTQWADAAVESIDKIVEPVKEIEKKMHEKFIVSFITGLLFIVHFESQALGSISLAAPGSLLLIAGATSEAGLMVYEIVEDPANTFLTVFSYLAGAGVGRSGFTKAANVRRSMDSSDINKLGSIRTDLHRIEDLRGGACKI